MTDNINDVLLPCPFCGGEANIKQFAKNGLELKCSSCLIWYKQRVLKYSLDWLKNEMIKKWNTREWQSQKPKGESHVPTGGEFSSEQVKYLLEWQIRECANFTQRCARDKGQASFEMNEWVNATPLVDFEKETYVSVPTVLRWVNGRNLPDGKKPQYVTRYPGIPDEYKLLSKTDIEAEVDAEYEIEWLCDESGEAPLTETKHHEVPSDDELFALIEKIVYEQTSTDPMADVVNKMNWLKEFILKNQTLITDGN